MAHSTCWDWQRRWDDWKICCWPLLKVLMQDGDRTVLRDSGCDATVWLLMNIPICVLYWLCLPLYQHIPAIWIGCIDPWRFTTNQLANNGFNFHAILILCFNTIKVFWEDLKLITIGSWCINFNNGFRYLCRKAFYATNFLLVVRIEKNAAMQARLIKGICN